MSQDFCGQCVYKRGMIMNLKMMGLGGAVCALSVFAAAPTLTHISSANHADGVWVKLCASGRSIFLPISTTQNTATQDAATETLPGGDEAPGAATLACHACPDRRVGDIDIDDDGELKS